MKTQILTGFLLLCSATAVSVHRVAEDRRNALEAEEPLTDVRPGLFVLNDDGEPVEIDLLADDDESEEETRKDLHRRVFFYLYTKNSDTSKPEKLFLNDVDGLRRSAFNPRKPTQFITHGWINSYKSAACVKVRDVFLQHGDYNVIVVDWSSISIKPYIWTTKRVLMVGQYVSNMINFLESQGMDLSQVTIVGHSLGGHIAGLSAHYAKHQVNYVVSLDPALPNFLDAKPGYRVSRGDAKYVQIIHTNGGLLGFKNPLGDSDFYPNGGMVQHGCVGDVSGSCSHSRAFEYFAESLNTEKGFLAVQCDSYENFKKGICKAPTAFMGGISPNYNVKGTYYLETNNRSPFARGGV